MFDAQLIRSSGSGFSVFSPWMQRQGDNAAVAIDVIALVLTGFTPAFQVFLYTKAFEDAGDGTKIDGGVFGFSITTAGISSGVVTGNMKDLVRYEFRFSDTSEADNWALIRVLPTSWFDTVKA